MKASLKSARVNAAMIKRAGMAILCAGLSGMALSVFAQPSIQMRLDVNPREITIGDPVVYKAAIVYSSQVTPAPLQLSSSTFGDFELLDYKASPPSSAGDEKLSVTFQFILTTFSTGTITIPPQSIFFVTENGEAVQADTERVSIIVQSLLEKYGDEGRLRPLKGLFNFRSYLWAWISLAGLALIVMGFFIWKWIKKRRKVAAEQAGPPKPPEVIAWEALNDLEFSGLLTDGNIKEFYSRLSQILRQYLEHRYRILTLERTTTELLVEFRRLNLSMDLTSLMRMTLETGDLVKFAKFTPTDQEIEEDLGRVKEIISLTTPKQVESRKEEEIPV